MRRPHRPYTFTQLVTLSDGSSFTQRTTSPSPLHRSTKDSRNNILWQPSMASLQNVEEDEAGRLKAFREKFGRGWDAEEVEGDTVTEGNEGATLAGGEAAEDSLMDLISGFQSNVTEKQMSGKIAVKEKKDKKK